MAIISGTITDHGPIIDVLVQVSRAREEKLRGLPPPDRVPPPFHVRALIDTGSSLTGFDPSVFRTLGIGHVTFTTLLTPSTSLEEPYISPTYDIRLTFVSGTDRYTFSHVQAIEVESFDPRDRGLLRGLIGRDILDRCGFNYFGLSRSFELHLQ